MIQLLPLSDVPEVRRGAEVGCLLHEAALRSGETVAAGDIVVVAQKIVSKAEGRLVPLETVTPSDEALRVAEKLGTGDARLVEVVLRETKRIVRMDHGVLIAETAHGFVCANAGVDLSNVDGGLTACLLPADPDASARRIAAEIESLSGTRVPVIVTDTFGRPWREGLVDVAIGVHGMAPVADCRGQLDPYGYPLRASVLADADQLAAAAGLLFRKSARVPACLIRGFACQPGPGSARDLIRPAHRDLFR